MNLLHVILVVSLPSFYCTVSANPEQRFMAPAFPTANPPGGPAITSTPTLEEKLKKELCTEQIKNKKLTNELNDAKSEKTIAEIKLADIAKENKSLASKITNLESRLKDATAKLSSSTSNATEIATLKKEINILTEKLRKAQQTTQGNYHASAQTWADEISARDLQIKQAKADLNELEIRVTNLQSRINILTDDNANLKNKVNTLTSEKGSLDRENTRLRNENAHLKNNTFSNDTELRLRRNIEQLVQEKNRIGLEKDAAARAHEHERKRIIAAHNSTKDALSTLNAQCNAEKNAHEATKTQNRQLHAVIATDNTRTALLAEQQISAGLRIENGTLQTSLKATKRDLSRAEKDRDTRLSHNQTGLLVVFAALAGATIGHVTR